MIAACKLISTVARNSRSQSSLVTPAMLALSGGTLLTASMYNTNNNISLTKCQGGYDHSIWHGRTTKCQVGYNDSEQRRFEEELSKHRAKLSEYQESWGHDHVDTHGQSHPLTLSRWPTKTTSPSEIPSLLLEIKFCNRSPNYRDDTSYCSDIKFRAAWAMLRGHDISMSRQGLAIMKDLAESGHPEGMVGYGICLMDGLGGLESNPQQAVGWFRRSIEMYDHPQAMYELGAALYTGEGVVEDEEKAVKYFRKAAKRGHSAAAYMLSDCLLDGVGVRRDRGKALRWLVRAAEAGHHSAQARVLGVLQTLDEEEEKPVHVYELGPADDDEDEELDMEEQILIERLHWGKKGVILAEKRYSIGGSSPSVLNRRKSIVESSRTTDKKK